MEVTDFPTKAVGALALSIGTDVTQSGTAFFNCRSAMSWPWEQWPSHSGWQITVASVRKCCPSSLAGTMYGSDSLTSPTHTAMSGPCEHGLIPPPKQCAAETANVGEMIDAPQPSQRFPSALDVGNAKKEKFAKGCWTTEPLTILVELRRLTPLTGKEACKPKATISACTGNIFLS